MERKRAEEGAARFDRDDGAEPLSGRAKLISVARNQSPSGALGRHEGRREMGRNGDRDELDRKKFLLRHRAISSSMNF